MKMTKNIMAIAVAATLGMGLNAATAEEKSSEGWQIGGVRIANPLDSSTWWEGSEAGHKEELTVNFADPDFWMSIPNPKTHSIIHGAMTNPETWAQFLDIKTYTNMLDTKVLEKWLNPNTYEVLGDPQTYAYWVQPGAYKHLVDADHYAQLANREAYNKVLEQGTATLKLAYDATIGEYAPKIMAALPVDKELRNSTP